MQNIATQLKEQLLAQSFEDTSAQQLLKYRLSAQGYASTENAIAVLSDLEAGQSYLYYGKFAEHIGIKKHDADELVPSIWEDEIFSKIHPDDLLQKHLTELRFFQFLKKLPLEIRSHYYVDSTIRMKDQYNGWISVQHRMFYVSSTSKGSVWLALCLYQRSVYHKQKEYQGQILNSLTGERQLLLDKKKYHEILSVREIEILKLIKKGKRSKEIAEELSISTFTVSRHRQNILQKLRVGNSFEACKIAESMGCL